MLEEFLHHMMAVSDEGCVLLLEPPAPVRRVRSTPNLLQIPSPSRSRKKSDDSALGSAEDATSSSCSSSVSADNSPISEHPPPSLTERSSESSLLIPQIVGGPNLLRPPSVVVSDHDLVGSGEERWLTLDDLDAEYNLRGTGGGRRLSDCSTCSSMSFSELHENYYGGTTPTETEEEEVPLKTSRWRTIRTIVHQLTPFIQTYKKQRYPWVQLAGHQGNFKAGFAQGTILKRYAAREAAALEALMGDPALRPFVPTYHDSLKDDEGTQYVQLEDLLSPFRNPCVMDTKLGVRTYLEEELLKAKEKPKLRKDMYEKMLQIDPSAPLPEEHCHRGVTKPRYMVWRETISTTATLGFRIEGIRKSDGTSSKDFKTVRSEDKVREALGAFVDGNADVVVPAYIARLKDLRAALTRSPFFCSHEVIGSSLLFVHDSTQASVWMIDFAKTVPLPPGVPPLTHDQPWVLGNHEDGYLIGLDNLIGLFEDLLTLLPPPTTSL